MKVLVADGSEEGPYKIETFLHRMGHESLIACTCAETLRLAETEQPDILLVDVGMLTADGLQLPARLKALMGGQWVPLVLLTDNPEEAALSYGIEVEGDDYLTKPITFAALKAKLGSFGRLLQLRRQLDQKSAELEDYHHAAEDEQRVAAHLMKQLVRVGALRDPLLDYWIQPARELSGDLVAAARTPGGVLHVMLADGTGHGLTASLNVLPIVDPFYAMTGKGCSIGAIVTELNDKLKRWLPVDRFVAATLIAYDPYEQLIEVWSGGNPPPFLLDGVGRMVYEFANLNVPLGVMSRSEFDAQTHTLRLDEPCRLVVCSDGAVEAEGLDGKPFGRDRLIHTLRNAKADDHFAGLKLALANHFAGRTANDDISIVSIDCVEEAAGERRTEVPITRAPGQTDDGRWAVQTILTAEELKYIDTVPLLLGLIQQFHGMQPHSAQVFLILSELFNNALDHGLLALDSRIKDRFGGMEKFFEVRERRLAELHQASIEIGLRMTTIQGRALLEISIKDSGPGFDYRPFFTSDPHAGTAPHPHGRGIALVRSLCAEVEYRGYGNEVTVLYEIAPHVRSESDADRLSEPVSLSDSVQIAHKMPAYSGHENPRR